MKVDIFGEVHTFEDRNRVEEMIIANHKKVKYDYLLSEEIGNYRAMTEDMAKIGIQNSIFGISDRSYHLGIKLGIPIIGIDTWDEDVYRKDKKLPNGMAKDFSRSFLLRETQMVKVISEFAPLGNCAVIVGDSHLRLTKVRELGDISLIQKELGNEPWVHIYRSPEREIE